VIVIAGRTQQAVQCTLAAMTVSHLAGGFLVQLRRGTAKQLIERISDEHITRHRGVIPSVATLFLFPFGNEMAIYGGPAEPSVRMRYVSRRGSRRIFSRLAVEKITLFI